MQASEQIAKQLMNAEINRRTWGDILYIATVYGVVGGGIKDDTAALQALVNLAISEGRKLIYLPNGKFKVTSLVNGDQVIFLGDNAQFVGGYNGTINQIGYVPDMTYKFDAIENVALTSMVTQSRIPNNEISASKFKTSSDADKLKLINLSDEVRQAMAGSTPINTTPAAGSIVTEYYADKSITPFKLKDAVRGKNIFDKEDITEGYYAEVSSGTLFANASYFVSGFIEVSPSTQYIRNVLDQTCFYTSSKTFISGVSGAPAAFTTPATCKYMRVSAPLTKLDTLQFELGSVSTSYESYNYTLERLKLPEVNANVVSQSDYISNVMEQLDDPFVKTNIKALGDSIAAGERGTGYSATGEPIGSTGYNANVVTATCWANLLRTKILADYNKDHYIELDHPKIKNNINQGSYNKDNGAYLKWVFSSLNTIAGQNITFDFYGDHFSIVHGKTSGAGILEVYVDGVKKANLDTYSTTTTYSTEAAYTGLTMAKHSVEIRQTATKNAASSATTIYLEAIKIPKVITVKNWGVSGVTSEWIYDNLANLIESSDDIVLLSIGTNDRISNKSPSASRIFFRKIIEYVQGLNKKIILVVANPVSASNDSLPVYQFKMPVVNALTAEIAREYDMNLISNYDHMQEYTAYMGVTLESLLDDELHPNDTGHTVMYGHVAKSLGLSL